MVISQLDGLSSRPCTAVSDFGSLGNVEGWGYQTVSFDSQPMNAVLRLLSYLVWMHYSVVVETPDLQSGNLDSIPGCSSIWGR